MTRADTLLSFIAFLEPYVTHIVYELVEQSKNRRQAFVLPMKRIIDKLRDFGIPCLPNERFTLNVDMFDGRELEHPVPKNIIYETPQPAAKHIRVREATDSYFRYFLDGSQTFHHVIDASFGGAYLPICAAQVGVAVLERHSSSELSILKTNFRRILLVPRGRLDDDLEELKRGVNESLDIQHHFDIEEYNPRGDGDREEEPEYHARARVLAVLHDMEIATMEALLREGHLAQDRWLAIDGGLQFQREKKLEKLLQDDIFARNVIALAKTFRPSKPIKAGGRKAQDLGNLIKGLEFGQRTPAFSSDPDERVVRSSWYLRMRPQHFVYRPLQGVIKIEVFADRNEMDESGLDSARVDGISACVLRERNVTPYDSDKRWGNHLYPIYLVERYLKSCFLSELRFKAMII